MEAQLFDRGNNLSQLCVRKLTGNGWRHHGVNFIFLVVFAFFQHFYHIGDKGFIHNGTPRAHINTSSAGNALAVVNLRGFGLCAGGNRIHLTGDFAGAALIDDGAVRTRLGAAAAVDAFFLINMSPLVLIKSDRITGAHIFTAVSQAAAAGLGHLIAAHGAFITGNVDNLNHVGVFLKAAHGHMDAFVDDRPFFVYAASHGRLVARHDGIRNIDIRICQPVLKGMAGNFPQNLIF